MKRTGPREWLINSDMVVRAPPPKETDAAQEPATP